MFNKVSEGITKENNIYVFIDASNLWGGAKSQRKIF